MKFVEKNRGKQKKMKKQNRKRKKRVWEEMA